jgi:aminoglycoside 3-N-acetyltransferase I
MHERASIEIRRLRREDVTLMHDVLAVFGAAFGDPATDVVERPRAAYLRQLLGRADVIALAALVDGAAVGGLVAHVLPKFEQERNEIYLYDLAVATAHRRRGVATALIDHLRWLADDGGACGIYVQADVDDTAAIALYTTRGARADVVHFDIWPAAASPSDHT